jgi:hypothetical protein
MIQGYQNQENPCPMNTITQCVRTGVHQSNSALLLAMVLTFAGCREHNAVSEAEYSVGNHSLIILCGYRGCPIRFYRRITWSSGWRSSSIIISSVPRLAHPIKRDLQGQVDNEIRGKFHLHLHLSVRVDP